MTPSRRVKGRHTIALAVLAAMGCQSNPVKEDPAQAAALADMERAGGPDATLIVDCLLPGKIKKLGSSFTYLTPRRPAKVSSQDCEIRGGEYVAFDRADYETALRVWKPMADEGDPVAQTYVAAIFEKGLGVPPDFAQAAAWYQKAADQGYSRAQFALGYLYETGAGVTADPIKAMNLYRAAAGLPPENVVAVVVPPDEASIAREKEAQAQEQALMDKVKGDLAQKESALAQSEQQLQSAKAKLKQNETDLAALRQRAEQAEKNQAALEQQLAQNQSRSAELDVAVQEKQRALAELDQQLAAQRQTVASRADELKSLVDEIEARQSVLQGEIARLTAAEESINAKLAAASNDSERRGFDQEQANIGEQLAAAQRQLNETNQALARQKAVADKKGKELLALMSEVESRKASMRAEMSALEKQRQENAQTRAALEAERSALTAQFQREQQNRVADLARQQQVIAQLEKQSKSNEESIVFLERAQSSQHLAMLAPQIEIIDPQIPIVRSTGAATSPVLTVRSGVKERTIVGKVSADADVLLLSVNDRTVPISTGGMFNTLMTVESSGTLVDVVAVDTAGRRSQVKFVLAPEQIKRDGLPGAGGVVASAVEKPRLPDIEFGNYYALLIGNNEYTHMPKLLTPGRDVDAAAKLLKEKYGFKETFVLKDATRYDIITKLNDLRKQLNEKDNLLVYYAGHGELDRVNMTGQWLPVDAEAENTANWISNNALTELLNAIPAKHILVVADSCYSGIMTRSALTNLQSGQSDDARFTWLKKMLEKRSRTVLTSGGVAPVLDEGGGDHSVFARAFLDVLATNEEVLEGQRLFRQVSAAVAVAADRYKVDQVPEYAPIRHAGHESGEFFLVPRGGV